MDNAVCPICGEAVAFVPSNWSAEVVHGPHGHHAVLVTRPSSQPPPPATVQ